jgi:Mg2+ and Co2+ transporter CorA
MKQRIFSNFQDYLTQYISHQYQDLLYCNSSQYILSTYNSQHNNNNNNVVLAMTIVSFKALKI